MIGSTKNRLSSGGSYGSGGSRPPGRECVIWTEEMTEYLIDALLHQQDVGNRSAEGRFLTVAFENVITGVGERFGVGIDRSNIKNRLKHVKDMFHECENLFDKQSGFNWNPATRRFHADPQVWRQFIEVCVLRSSFAYYRIHREPFIFRIFQSSVYLLRLAELM
jgi:hypothetical protein